MEKAKWKGSVQLSPNSQFGVNSCWAYRCGYVRVCPRAHEYINYSPDDRAHAVVHLNLSCAHHFQAHLGFYELDEFFDDHKTTFTANTSGTNTTTWIQTIDLYGTNDGLFNGYLEFYFWVENQTYVYPPMRKYLLPPGDHHMTEYHEYSIRWYLSMT